MIRPSIVLLSVLLAACDLISGPANGPDFELLVFHDSVEAGNFALVVRLMPDSTFAASELPGTWSTSNAAVADVLGGGIVQAVAPGTASITYRAAGEFGRTRITVVPPLADAATFGHAIVEGSLPVSLPGTPLTYSCGPGLFGGSTLTTAESTFRFQIRYPDSLRADLLNGDQIACAVRGYNMGWTLGDLVLGYQIQFLATPMLQFVESPSPPPTDITDLVRGASHYYVGSSVGRSDTVLTVAVGDTLHVNARGGGSSTYNVLRSLSPDIAEAPEYDHAIIGRSVGVAAIEIWVIRPINGEPMWPAGVFGVRVTH